MYVDNGHQKSFERRKDYLSQWCKFVWTKDKHLHAKATADHSTYPYAIEQSLERLAFV